jgi:membrane protease YdiL (CAAX protease family)
VLLSLTFIIDFKERIDPLFSDRVTVRLIDVGFRMMMGALLIFVVTPWLLGLGRSPGWIRAYLRHMRVSPGDSPQRTILVMVAALGALVGLIVGLALALGLFEADLGVLIRDDQWIILLLAFVPGIWEELAFRGVILTNLQRHYSTRKAIGISSILFGLFHLSNFWGSNDAAAVLAGVVAATLLGIGWGYIVVGTNSIFPAMLLHYMVDVLLDAETFIDPQASEDSLAPLYLGLIVLWPLLTILITRVVTAHQPDAVGYGS